jgi:hypothetical protein
MTPEQRQKESLILIALGKAFSEQATKLTGELKHKPKQIFNQSVSSVDLLIRTIENNLTENEAEYLANVTDIYHNINLEIRKHNAV